MRIFKLFSMARLLFLLFVFTSPAPLNAINNAPNEALSLSADPVPVRTGEKLWIDRDRYILCALDKSAQVGNNTFVLEIFDKNNKQLIGYLVTGHSDMPAMRGAHASGVTSFVLSKNGQYRLPVALVMPGGWEIRFTIRKDDRVIFNGIFYLNV